MKIGIAWHKGQYGLGYCAYDTFCLKPFDVAELTQHNKFGLYHSAKAVRATQTPYPAYTRAALEMLDLPLEGSYYGYVDNFITWRRQSVIEMQNRLGEKHGGAWQRAFRNRLQVSEYNLYGLYVDHLS